jgi:GNAT superfamily N-acetyltransferase
LVNISPLRERHLEDAAVLVSRRYARLREQEPLLPARYTKVSEILPLLNRIFASTDHGVAAFRAGRLVGFLTGWVLPSFRGQRSTISPEWANAAELEDSQLIYEEMYSHIAANWVADRYVAHYITVFSNDNEATKAFSWMGFGMAAVDAVRNLAIMPSINQDIESRIADIEDIDDVMALDKALQEYMSGTPSFLLMERKSRNHYVEWILDPRKHIWLAHYDDEPIAFMSLGPANEDTCTIIIDEKTTSIFGAFTKESMRGKGVASTLLNQALELARAEEYERCAVDFEPMNLAGTRFWMRHFTPVCLSFFRQIDHRVTDLVDNQRDLDR